MNPTTHHGKDQMTREKRLIEHAAAVKAAHDAGRERERLRRRVARLDAKVQAGHANLAAFRDKTADAISGVR